MNRKMTPLLLCLAVSLFTEQALASDVKQDKKMHQRFGALNLQGTILEPTCAISAGSRYQVIPLTTVSIPTLVTQGSGPIDYFSIRLTECTLVEQKGKEADNPRFIATFEGPSQSGNFQLFGDAKGASLMIADRYGRQAIPGQPLPAVGIDSKSMALLYQARIVKNNDIPKAGNYQTTLRFKLEYY
ncbi:MAG TPA: type 1 fimbrial protein [Proteus sp.]|uniref:MrfB family protein n=1 Tax=Proteus hauseri ATCC 700826 TaxID=1354271 RepID=A0AAJ3LU98_PROHU|nr:fimbrial protein [Proteus hauseri]OAT48230.1 MrfB family protein [Proteus hauseri ATCC 700826]QAV23878.1 type 1 fimbrial protein [Proteus hauseri]HCH49132.1 type 1 fimbrial protein [Proteus sp. (in: enterobacteria)]